MPELPTLQKARELANQFRRLRQDQRLIDLATRPEAPKTTRLMGLTLRLLLFKHPTRLKNISHEITDYVSNASLEEANSIHHLATDNTDPLTHDKIQNFFASFTT